MTMLRIFVLLFYLTTNSTLGEGVASIKNPRCMHTV